MRRYANGTAPHATNFDAWHVAVSSASALLDGDALGAAQLAIRDVDTGFGAFGTNGWHAVHYDNLHIFQAGGAGGPPARCAANVSAGTRLRARACTRNGLLAEDTSFELLPTFQLRHVASSLCAAAALRVAGDEAPVALQPCDASDGSQLLMHDYTSFRNREMPLKFGGNASFALGGSVDGRVSAVAATLGSPSWVK